MRCASLDIFLDSQVGGCSWTTKLHVMEYWNREVIFTYAQGEGRGQVHEDTINRLPTAKSQLSVQTLPEFANFDTDEEATDCIAITARMVLVPLEVVVASPFLEIRCFVYVSRWFVVAVVAVVVSDARVCQGQDSA